MPEEKLPELNWHSTLSADVVAAAVSPERMATLMKVSRTLDDMLNRAPNRHAAYVGESAFVTKTGIHASAVLKDPHTYEHVAPESVGNRRKILVSDQAGRSNLLARLADAVDALTDDESEPLLYDPYDPRRCVLWDCLPMRAQVDDDGNIRSRLRFRAVFSIMCAIPTTIGYAVALYMRFFR